MIYVKEFVARGAILCEYLSVSHSRATFAAVLVNKLFLRVKVMNSKVGMFAGDVWTALNQNGALDVKELKKAAKLKTEKDLYLALGWLLREDKLVITEADKTLTVALK